MTLWYTGIAFVVSITTVDKLARLFVQISTMESVKNCMIFTRDAAMWVRETAYKKGEANMTVSHSASGSMINCFRRTTCLPTFREQYLSALQHDDSISLDIAHSLTRRVLM